MLFISSSIWWIKSFKKMYCFIIFLKYIDICNRVNHDSRILLLWFHKFLVLSFGARLKICINSISHKGGLILKPSHSILRGKIRLNRVKTIVLFSLNRDSILTKPTYYFIKTGLNEVVRISFFGGKSDKNFIFSKEWTYPYTSSIRCRKFLQ